MAGLRVGVEIFWGGETGLRYVEKYNQDVNMIKVEYIVQESSSARYLHY